MSLGRVQAISQKAYEDVRLDPGFQVMVDRADGQISFQVFERLLHLGKL